ncbi:MAG TPA: DUF3592 domain-containing protein [Aggregatilineaceae bacterium]|nr:DUF3592 domain-containing protein [Aggregatilineaceae bacterium]
MAGTVGVLLIGILLLVIGGRQIGRWMQDRRWVARFRSWPTAIGKITQSRVKFDGPLDDPEFSHAYVPDIGYKYIVNGVTYTGTAYADRDPDLEDTVRELVAQYPLGQTITVRYDARYPRDSIIETLEDYPAWKPLGIGLIALVVGLALVSVILIPLL